MMCRPGLEHKALVAIGAFHEILVAHFKIDFGVAQRAAAAIAGDTGAVSFDDFGGLDRHGKVPDWREENRRLGGSYKLSFARQVAG
jgi:hypothetical protein